MTNNSYLKDKEKENGNWVGGLVLISIGLLAFAGRMVDSQWLGLLIVPLIGMIFLVAGVLNREEGFLIPGGILSGVGLGIFLISGPFESMWPGDAEGGVFMLSFAAGWVLIVLMTAVFTDKTHYWPFIPAGIMALIGGGILFGGMFMNVLSFIGQAWPIGLIAVGVYILVQSNRQTELAETVE